MKIGIKGELEHTLPNTGNVIFHWERNELNNNMMYWFSNNNGMFSGTKTDVIKIIKYIKENYK